MIEIDKREVLRYLGYKKQVLSKDLDDTIDKIIIEAQQYLTPRYVYKVFEIDNNAENVLIKGTDTILYGNDIKKHLSDCDKCIFMAATLGLDIEKRITTKQLTSVNHALIMDACATVAIEKYCDNVETIIKSDLNIDDCLMNYRYSPGYGDFSIEFQPTFLNLVDAGIKIGLYATSSNILIPRKSVTAIIGILNHKKDMISQTESARTKNKCDFCENRERCTYRK